MTGFAPFMLNTTKRNVIFVKQLMKIICTLNGNTLTTREELRLNTGVERVMALPRDVLG